MWMEGNTPATENLESFTDVIPDLLLFLATSRVQLMPYVGHPTVQSTFKLLWLQSI